MTNEEKAKLTLERKKELAALNSVYPYKVDIDDDKTDEILNPGIKIQDYAAIHLGLPISGTYALDKKIYDKMVLDLITHVYAGSNISVSIMDAKETLLKSGFEEPKQPGQ